MAPSKEEEEKEHDSEEEDDDEDEDEDEEGSSEMVGYLEPVPSSIKEKKLLTRRMFPSKVGGKPAWLVPRNLPKLDCRKCSRPLRFLLQTYASRGEQRPEAFHRVLHVFVCTTCQPNEVQVFRAQLPRHNEFYSSEAPVEEDVIKKAYDDPEIDRRICWECGLTCGAEPDVDMDADEDEEASASAAAASGKGGYPSNTGSDDEAADASAGPSGKKKKKSKSEKKREAKAAEAAAEETGVSNRCDECARLLRLGDKPAMFQEREMTTAEASVPEYEDDEQDDLETPAKPEDKKKEDEEEDPEEIPAEEAAATVTDIVNSTIADQSQDEALVAKLKEFREQFANEPSYGLDGSEQKSFEEWSKERGEKDAVFSRFQRYSQENRPHVLRYIYGGRPIWFCMLNRLRSEPPACPCCGAARTFEMQIQPQLIALLAGTTDLACRLDYGTICIYSCSESCTGGAAPAGSYLEEFAYVQPEPGDAWLPDES